jgi:hypothetical protein
MSTKASSSTALDGQENTNATTRTLQRKRTKANDTRIAGGPEPRIQSAVRQPKTGQLSQLMSMPMDILMEVRDTFFLTDFAHI